MFWSDFFAELGRIGRVLVPLLLLGAILFFIRTRSLGVSRWHCARCRRTLRYPACCPHISESGWSMIKNAPDWKP